MNFDDYQKQALRTEHTPEFLVAPVATRRMMHGVMGISTEVGELCETITKGLGGDDGSFCIDDRVGLVEEVGDVLWYMAITADALETPFSRFFHTNPVALRTERHLIDTHRREGTSPVEGPLPDFCLLMSSDAGFLQDVMKRHLIYGAPLDAGRALSVLQHLASVICVFSESFGLSMDYATDRNIAKLRARFPEKYTTERVLSRDLDAERKALQGGA